MRLIRFAWAISICLLAAGGALWSTKPQAAETWTFDSVERIGGYSTHVLGDPQVIQGPAGKAVQFNGAGDAIFLDVHPLAGAAMFTWEVIFRPDLGGRPEQRFFHLQEQGTETRMLMEIRTIGGQWFLDSFVMSGRESRTLFNKEHLHPLGEWYHVATVYDGRELSNYVNGMKENAALAHLEPQGPGRSSIGVRINLRDYFKGAVARARMTRRALSPKEFMPIRP